MLKVMLPRKLANEACPEIIHLIDRCIAQYLFNLFCCFVSSIEATLMFCDAKLYRYLDHVYDARPEKKTHHIIIILCIHFHSVNARLREMKCILSFKFP